MKAFPDPGRAQSAKQRETLTEAGMDLRDYFAEGAMRAFVATCPSNCLNGLHGYEDQTAKAAYRMADAMLKAREEEQ